MKVSKTSLPKFQLNQRAVAVFAYYKHPKLCFNCGQPIPVRESESPAVARHKKFCNQSCAALYNSSHRPKSESGGLLKPPNPPKIHICKKCGADYTNTEGYKSQAYCKSCRLSMPKDFLKSVTLEYIHSYPCLKDKHPSWVNAQVRGLNRDWNRNLLSLPCAQCGYSKHVELCHKRPISDFLDSSFLSEVNHPSNVVQLCRNCHWELDHGLLILEGEPGVQPGLLG